MAEDIGGIYTTKQPSYDESADIQAALKLFLYGSTGTPPATKAAVNDGIAKHIKDLDTRVEAQETLGIGSDHITLAQIEAIASPTDGFIAMASDSTGSSVLTSYATTVYTNDAPTTGLVNGMIWVDKDSSPLKSYVYDSATSSFIPMNELENTVDAAGDLLYGSADNTLTKLPIGTSGQVLKVSSGLPSWTDDKSWKAKGTGSLSGSSISISGINGSKFYVILKDWSHDDLSDSAMINIRFNNDSGPNYVNTGGIYSSSALHSPAFLDNITHDMTILVDLANSNASLKPVSSISDQVLSGAGDHFGYYKNTNPITSIQIYLSPLGSFDAGSYEIWSYE